MTENRELRTALLRYRNLFFKLLFFVELGVVALAANQFVVGAEFGDASGDQDGDLIRVARG